MTTIQLELPFILEDPEHRVNRALETIETRFERNRKSLHVKTSQMAKKVNDVDARLSWIEAFICRGQMELKF